VAERDTTILPPDDEAAFRALVDGLRNTTVPSLTLADGSTIDLPVDIAEALRGIVEALAQGKAVTVAPQHTTLTTQQAADLLGISRPTFVKRLEEGDIPFTKPGRHRRVRLSDVLAYRNRMRSESSEALDRLAQISQDAGLYESADRPKRTR
jgi:excisionase family DNA binding protein